MPYVCMRFIFTYPNYDLKASMKSLLPVLSVTAICLFFSCKEKKVAATQHGTIAYGTMPAITVDANNQPDIVYGNGDSLMMVTSVDGGISFGKPVLVDTLPGLVDFATRGPQIAATKQGLAIIGVNKQGNIYAYQKAYNGDWSKAQKVNDSDEVAKEGFLALASNEKDLYAVWLDLRGNKRNKIAGAKSTDNGASWSANKIIYQSPDSSVCECCKVSVAMNSDKVYVMFRNWLKGNRDLHIIASTDGGQTFGAAQKLGNGNWKLDGCPMDGGSLAVNDDTIETTWRRRDSIFADKPGQQENFIAIGKTPSVAANTIHQLYAWVKDGTVFYKLNNNKEQVIGKGNLPSVKILNEKEAICIFTNNNEINYQRINL